MVIAHVIIGIYWDAYPSNNISSHLENTLEEKNVSQNRILQPTFSNYQKICTYSIIAPWNEMVTI